MTRGFRVSKAKDEDKARLIAIGKWPDFVYYRDKLKAEGLSNPEAHKRALAQFLGSPAPGSDPDFTAPSPPFPGGGHPGRSSHTAPGGGDGSFASGVAPVPAGRVTATMADFEGKKAGAVEMVLWVARHMDLSDVTPADCPDPMALSLLNECRTNPLFRHSTFWQALFRSCIPSRSQLEDKKDDATVDGNQIIGACDELLGEREMAESTSGGG